MNCVPICDSYTCEEDADDVQSFAALSGRCTGHDTIYRCRRLLARSVVFLS
ncbi:hypothetical protein DPMN_028618 [Dreissena polymorpha]|uniref:Uncharacterized protein n=1 Tax=Dreissena polymorpha TaxID=45954 RepID=A0A9D4RF48_DREPO|nr:hypothetical protein DPMN_028222 [Dreissena polymorpha]KAH3865577.1 hypothetical protein DPMN_028618 [Dreissena polymorpha]